MRGVHNKTFSQLGTLWIVLMLGLSSGCAFLESAFELTFGEGDIDPVEQTIALPSVEEMTGLSQEDTADIPGFPGSLKYGTFAHLQGALTLTGDCSRSFALTDLEDSRIKSAEVGVFNCTLDPRCADICGADYAGIVVESRITIQIVDEALAAELTGALSAVTPEAIVQVRLQISALDVLFGPPEQTVSLMPLLDDFQLWFANEEGDEVLVVKKQHIGAISAETPQRFDVDSASAFTQKLKGAILGGQTADITVVQRMRVAQPDLYEIQFDGARVIILMQPEFVVSALEAATSQL
jgi:hypothetical protein